MLDQQLQASTERRKYINTFSKMQYEFLVTKKSEVKSTSTSYYLKRVEPRNTIF
jgi:hypothetical protein